MLTLKTDNQIKKILFFDSGIGGLSTLAETIKQMPGEQFIYFADDLNAPFGSLSKEKLVQVIFENLDRFACEIKAIVVACNTATGAAIELIRERYAVPVVGTEPAILPAGRIAGNSPVVILVTPLESRQEKFLHLAEKLNAFVFVMPELAETIEKSELGLIPQSQVLEKIGIIENFAEEANSKVLVLGCTHYVFLKKHKYFSEKFVLLDGNRGVANQLARLLKEASVSNRVQCKKTAQNKNVYVEPRRFLDFVEIILSSMDVKKQNQYMKILENLL